MRYASRLHEEVKALLASQKLAVLSTQQSGHPYSSLVCFFASEDLKRLFFATPRTTRKFTNLQADARVSLLIDSRTNRETDLHEAMAATAVGTAAEIRAEDRDAVHRAYLKKHPYLEDFITAPTSAMIRVTVSAYFVVKRFQQVMELHLDDPSPD